MLITTPSMFNKIDTETIKMKLDQACGMYLAEQEKLRGFAQVIFNLNHSMTYRAFDNVLKRLIESNDPSRPQKLIAEIEKFVQMAKRLDKNL